MFPQTWRTAAVSNELVSGWRSCRTVRRSEKFLLMFCHLEIRPHFKGPLTNASALSVMRSMIYANRNCQIRLMNIRQSFLLNVLCLVSSTVRSICVARRMTWCKETGAFAKLTTMTRRTLPKVFGALIRLVCWCLLRHRGEVQWELSASNRSCAPLSHSLC